MCHKRAHVTRLNVSRMRHITNRQLSCHTYAFVTNESCHDGADIAHVKMSTCHVTHMNVSRMRHVTNTQISMSLYIYIFSSCAHSYLRTYIYVCARKCHTPIHAFIYMRECFICTYTEHWAFFDLRIAYCVFTFANAHVCIRTLIYVRVFVMGTYAKTTLFIFIVVCAAFTFLICLFTCKYT